MTAPWGNPAPLPGSPRWPLTVTVKPCGCLDGDFCTCACDTTKDRIELASAPVILLPPHSSVPCLTDPALAVWRPGPDMVEQMCPPVRWHVTPAGVEVSL